MADITSRVRFIGDASQLLATYKAIQAQAEMHQRLQTRGVTAQLASLGVGPSAGTAHKDLGRVGALGKEVKSQFDSVNKVFRSTYETWVQTADGARILTGEIEKVTGNTDDFIKATNRYNKLAERAIPLEKGRAQAYQNSSTALNTLRRAEGARARAAISHIRGQERLGLIDAGTSRYLQGKEISRYQAFAASTPTQRLVAQSQRDLAALQRVRGLLSTAHANIYNARYGPATTIPAEIQNLGRLSPALLSQLQKSGLGTTPQALYGQNATASFSKDLISGTTRISGSFDGVNGVVQRFNAEIDKGGKLITRFGGQLSGVQNFLNQTARNFQKVVQWGIATTAVFGSIAFLVRELGVLKQLDTNLNQLGITANFTTSETRALFGSIADIAIKTATPLLELTKSADDIALAVREVGKSTQDYTKDILNLTEAVGIYTNLTGEDTVKATDLLVSSMKQLSLGTEDVTSLLSKITAVAGGQSNAISDITQGLAVMAEAARQAGLSTEETIAAVQVLSQVTAKSPSEIATAFKNLVGSLDSRAGAKALASFNINLRDGAGNLRNILDIYGEISDKIRQGIIPADEVKGLVKAIAGGPRRVPDAAALLSAIDDIAAGEERALRATNEALIVNAQVLGTTQAKLTQLQSAFDKFAFEKFGAAFKSSVEGLLDGVTSLLNLLNSIDTSLISGAIQVGVFFASLKIGAVIIRTLLGIVTGLATSIKGLGGAFTAAAVQAKLFQTSVSSGSWRLGDAAAAAGAGRAGLLRGVAGSQALRYGALGGALGAGVSAASSGGDLGAMLSGGLAGLGFGLLTVPSPDPYTKLGGAAALAASAVISLINSTNEVAESTTSAAEAAEKLLNAFKNYSAASDTVKKLKKEQGELSKTLRELNAKEEKSQAELSQLQDFQRQYISNTIEMAAANMQLADSFDLIKTQDPVFAAAIKAAESGTIGAAKLEEYIQKLQLELLRQGDPDAVLPGERGLITPVRAPIIPFDIEDERETGFDSSVVNIPTSRKQVGRAVVVTPAFDLDLENLDFEGLKAVLENGLDNVPLTTENLALLSKALNDIKASGQELDPVLEKTLTTFIQQSSAVEGAALAFASYQNRIDALKYFKPEQAAEFQKLLDKGKEIAALFEQQGNAEGIFAIQEQLQGFLSGDVEVNQSSLKEFATLGAEALGLLSDEALSAASRAEILNGVIISMSPNWAILRAGADSMANLTTEILEAQKAMEGFTNSTLADLAQKTAELQAQFQGGEFAGNEEAFTKQMEFYSQLADSVIALRDIYIDASDAVGESLDPAIQELAESLEGINGLQDASSLSAQQLIERMLGLADTYGLTGVQVVELQEKIERLFAAAQTLARLRVEFPIIANMDVRGAIAKLKALDAALKAAARTPGFSGLGLPYVGGSFGAAIRELEAVQNISFSSTYGAGGGTSTYKPPKSSSKSSSPSSSSSSTRKKYDVSTLDLPEEIADAANRDALIKEAIRRAKELQKQIPGATGEAKNDIVALLKGTQKILEVRGVKDDLLRKALEELADIEKKRLEFETKADTIRRIRVGSGSFAAIANVPVNTRTGVSLGGPEGPINISLNLNGTVLTPAQFQQFADMVAAALKRQIAG